MSRSRRKLPGYADRNPYMKNYANRRLRVLERMDPYHESMNHGRYRRLTSPWNICDWRVIYTRQEWLATKHPYKWIRK